MRRSCRSFGFSQLGLIAHYYKRPQYRQAEAAIMRDDSMIGRGTDRISLKALSFDRNNDNPFGQAFLFFVLMIFFAVFRF